MSEYIMDQEVSIKIDRCVHACTLAPFYGSLRLDVICCTFLCTPVFVWCVLCASVILYVILFYNIRLVWDKDQKYGQAREYSPEKMFARLESLKSKPPKFPVRCMVWKCSGTLSCEKMVVPVCRCVHALD